MAAITKIEWATRTFNFCRGCQHAPLADGSTHPGCDHCYAEAMSRRNPAVLGRWGGAGTRVVAAEKQWKAVERWNERAPTEGLMDRVFCESMGDLFDHWQGPMVNAQGRELWVAPEEPHRYVPWRDPDDMLDIEKQNIIEGRFRPLTMADIRQRLFGLIDRTPNLFWLPITKRPGNIRRCWPDEIVVDMAAIQPGEVPRPIPKRFNNVALLTSISDQPTADELIPELLQCRDLVPVLGLSIEPLLGPVNFGLLPERHPHPSGDHFLDWTTYNNCLTGFRAHKAGGWFDPKYKIDFVIVGGESGPGARPFHLDWVRSIRNQCAAAGVAFFLKQLGAYVIGEVRECCGERWLNGSRDATCRKCGDIAGCGVMDYRPHDKKGGDPNEWPEDLRVREFPKEFYWEYSRSVPVHQ